MEKINRICAVYFSPTGTTRKITEYLASKLSELLKIPYQMYSYTLPEERAEMSDSQRRWEKTVDKTETDFLCLTAEDLLIWATPVYAGRIPNKTLDFVKQTLKGCSTPSIPVVVYGNRCFDNALSELAGIMRENGCIPVGAAAVVARHTFSETLAAGRPEKADFEELDRLAAAIAEKEIIAEAAERIGSTEPGDAVSLKWKPVTVPGEEHPEKYYVPLKEDGTPAKFLKAKPLVDSGRCTGCGACQAVCPMGSITRGSLPEFAGICIKCQACRRTCPNGAIYFEDEDFLSHVRMVENNYADAKKTEIFYPHPAF